MENNSALLISLQASAFATFKQVNAFSFNHKSVKYSLHIKSNLIISCIMHTVILAEWYHMIFVTLYLNRNFCKNRYGVYNQRRSMVLIYQTADLSLILRLCFRLTIYVPLNSEVLVSGCTKSCQVVLTRLHQ